jgi:hypothetical protein
MIHHVARADVAGFLRQDLQALIGPGSRAERCADDYNRRKYSWSVHTGLLSLKIIRVTCVAGRQFD